MRDIKRYDLMQVNACYTTDHQMEPSGDGEWMRYEDAEALLTERAALQQERDEAVAQIPTGPPSDPGGRLILNAYGRAAWEEGHKAAERRAEASLATLRTELENADIKLAACSTAAVGNTPTMVAQRIDGGHPYWSVAYGDVCGAVDREMRWRERAKAAEAELSTLRAAVQQIEQKLRRKAVAQATRRDDWLTRGDGPVAATHHARQEVYTQVADALARLQGAPQTTKT